MNYKIGDLPEISQADIIELSENDDFVKIESNEYFNVVNDYFINSFPGTNKDIFIRSAVYKRLVRAISKLGDEYKFKIFDGFRTIETQKYIFELFKKEISSQQPNLAEEELIRETIKLVPHPEIHPKKYDVLPHNSGGAIDLTIEKNGTELDMGTKFDEVSIYIDTDFFEKDMPDGFNEDRWLEIRQNRRILYSLMIEQGFTNHPGEWWHYNLGNCPWAIALDTDWIYGEVKKPDFIK